MNDIVTTRKAPWIGLGTSGEWSDSQTALADAGMMFNVVQQPMVLASDGQVVPGFLANVREDTGDIMGVTTDSYGLVQNDVAFSMLDPWLQDGGVITHAGMTQTGMMFMIAELTRFNALGDEYTLYAAAMNSFNTKFTCTVFLTTLRIVCQNMFAKLIRSEETAKLTFRHSQYVEGRVINAASIARRISDYERQFTDKLDKLAMQPASTDKFLDVLFPFGLKEDAPRYMTSKIANEEAREDFISNYYNVDDNSNFIGTKLGLLNAYYDYLSHRPGMRNTGKNWDDVRFSGLMSGQMVQKKIMEMVA